MTEATAQADPVEMIAAALGEDSAPVEDEQQAPEVEAEADQVESEEDSQPDTEEDESEGEEATDETDLTVGQFLGIDDAEISEGDDGIKVKVKIDGDETFVPISELRDGYQFAKRNTQVSMELAEERKRLDSERAALSEKDAGKAGELEAALQAVGAMLNAEFAGINWNDLRTTNPTEFLLKQQEMNAKAGQVKQYQQMVQDAQAQAQQAYEAAEFQTLLNVVPEWRDESVRRSEMNQMTAAAMEAYGLTAEELSRVSNHKEVLILRDALAGRQMRVKAEAVAKPPKRKLPKFTAPGAAVRSTTKTERDAKGRFAKAKATGDVDDVAANLISILDR